MKKVLKTILMGAVAFSLAMGVGCGTGENSSLEKESSKAEDSSSQNKRRQLRDKSDYGKVIALTFDDGPNTDTTPLVLDKLEEHGIVASFFVIGNNITDESAEVMKRAYNMGCDIENHSQSHPDMTKMTAEEIKAEINFTSDKVKKAVGGKIFLHKIFEIVCYIYSYDIVGIIALHTLPVPIVKIRVGRCRLRIDHQPMLLVVKFRHIHIIGKVL